MFPKISLDVSIILFVMTYKSNFIQGHSEPKYAHLNSSAVIILPKKGKSPAPLILWPHGGPHSAVMSTYMTQVCNLNVN